MSAGVLQPLMCACLGCEVATVFFFSFWKQWAILPTVLCICALAPFGDVVMCFRILYFGDVSINVAHLLTRYAGWQYQQPHPGPPLGSRYFKNVRLLQQDLSTLIRRYLEIVELKDLNLRIKENLIDKMKREDSIYM
jgi:hypothetical protein